VHEILGGIGYLVGIAGWPMSVPVRSGPVHDRRAFGPGKTVVHGHPDRRQAVACLALSWCGGGFSPAAPLVILAVGLVLTLFPAARGVSWWSVSAPSTPCLLFYGWFCP